MLSNKKRKADFPSNRELQRQVVARIGHTDDSAETSNQNSNSPDMFDDSNVSESYTPVDQLSSNPGSDDDSIESDTSDDSIDQILDFKTQLTGAFLRTDMNHVQINAVLKVLRTHPCHSTLPKDARTVLKTSRIPCKILNVAGGEYIDLDFETGVRSILQGTPKELIPSLLQIDFSTDGATLDKQNKNSIWPIQIRVANIRRCKPEIVAIWKGQSKPNSAEEFFKRFIDQVLITLNNGGILFLGKKREIIIRCFIADAPGRAFALNHLAHNSEYPCIRCWIQGKSVRQGVIVFTKLYSRAREMNELSYSEGGRHSKGECPLLRLGIDPTKQVPFEYQHLFCHGCTGKLLKAIVDGKYNLQKLKPSAIRKVNKRLNTIKEYCPVEYARNPIDINKHGTFKDTEHRQILAYTGPVIFKGIIHDDAYTNFLLLHIGTRICMSPNSTDDSLFQAEEVFKTFWSTAKTIYGQEFFSYNIHVLTHAVEDVRRFGRLDSYSAFPYENNMMYFKKVIRKPGMILQQVVNRRMEKTQFERQYLLHRSAPDYFKCSQPHNSGPLIQTTELNHYQQFRKYFCPRFTVRLSQNDNTFILSDSSVCVIENILKDDNDVIFLVKKFEKKEDFFNIAGISSSSISTFLCSSLSAEYTTITFQDLRGKCFRMPFWDNADEETDTFVVSAMFSTFEDAD